MTTTYGRNYVPPVIGGKTSADIMRRIAMLGDMNDRHKSALGNRDKQALKEIAIEYDAINCPRIANAIRTEAKAIRRTPALMPEAVTA
jgi:hypothetical protein